MKIVKSNVLGFVCLLSAAAVIVGCSSVHAEETESAFEYREIYLPESLGKNARNLDLNSVDFDWGIWGHNLSKVLPEDPAQNIYAKHDGNVIHDQFCFMSNHLFKYIEEYIVDNYGEKGNVRFAIVPNDNDIVCLCAKCTAVGNTKTDASPAVFDLIKRLCERFPNHTFFTSYYNTTKNLPKETLPSNSGVLISAMEYPRNVHPTSKEEQFDTLIRSWKEKVSNVYIWDYINNFDDYFTPFPIYNTMQRRLQIYKMAGVDGVFFNGSGPDFSAFSKLHANVLSALVKNPDIDWKPLLKSLCEQYYPVTGNVIYDFILAQEDFAMHQGKELPMYDGVAKAVKTYLPGNEFVTFYNTLLSLQNKTEGEEKAEIDKLIKALSLTRLELARIGGNVEGCEPALQSLNSILDDGIGSYNEAYWSIHDYVRDYTFLNEHAKANQNNLLKGVKLTAMTPLDEDYEDISIITDGTLGIPSNYHSGNLICSAESLVIKIPYLVGMKNLRVGFVRNRAYHIGFPSHVSLSADGLTLGSAVPERSKEHAGHSFVEFDIPPTTKGPLILTVTRNPDERTMAIDEIETF